MSIRDTIHDDGAAAARAAWERAFCLAHEALADTPLDRRDWHPMGLPFSPPIAGPSPWAIWRHGSGAASRICDTDPVVESLARERCLNYHMPRVFRHGGRWWRIVGPYIAEIEDEDGEVLAVFTSDGEPREFRLVEGSRYVDLQVGNGRYPIEG